MPGLVSRLRAHLSYANVMATVAAFLALSGAAIAIGLRKNQVKSRHIARGAVKTADLAANSVRAAQIAAGSVGSSELANGAVKRNHLSGEAVLPQHLDESVFGAFVPSNQFTGGAIDIGMPLLDTDPPNSTVDFGGIGGFPDSTLSVEGECDNVAGEPKARLIAVTEGTGTTYGAKSGSTGTAFYGFTSATAADGRVLAEAGPNASTAVDHMSFSLFNNSPDFDDISGIGFVAVNPGAPREECLFKVISLR